MPKYVRARQGVGVLVHPESGAVAAPNPGVPYESTDPLVKAFPWAFLSDEELAKELEDDTVAWRPNAIEAARLADEQLAERQKAIDEAEAEAVKLAKARADGKPQGDDADRADEPEVEAATAAPAEKRPTRRRK